MIIKRTPLRFGALLVRYGALFIAFSLVATPLSSMATATSDDGELSPQQISLPKDITNYPFDKISEEPLFAVAMFCLSFIGSYRIVHFMGKSLKRMVLGKKDRRVFVTVNR